MEIERILPVILIVGIISLYFLISGINGLRHGRMRVLNPLARNTPASPGEVILHIFKKKVEEDYNVPEGFIDRRKQIDITGNELLFRAWLHIILGLLSIFVLIIFLYPELFYIIMDSISEKFNFKSISGLCTRQDLIRDFSTCCSLKSLDSVHRIIFSPVVLGSDIGLYRRTI